MIWSGSLSKAYSLGEEGKKADKGEVKGKF